MNPYAPPTDEPASGAAPSVPKAPPSTLLTVLGVLQCCFGAFGTLSAPITLVSRKLTRSAGTSQIDAILWEGKLGVWMMTSLVLGTVLAFVLIGAGIGVLKRRGYGRTLSLVHGGTTIAFGVVGQIVMVVFVYPQLIEMLDTAGPVARGGAIGGIVGGICGSVFGFVLPVAELVIMFRPAVKAELGVG